MCLALALTAAKLGAATANYTEVTGLVKTADGHVAGAKVQDRLTGITVSQSLLNTISLICHFHLFFILACMTAGRWARYRPTYEYVVCCDSILLNSTRFVSIK